MTHLEQHEQAMKEGGYSPYFGWIWDGRMVSRRDYLNEIEREQVRLDRSNRIFD